jgi:hypothetical protein
VPSFSVVLDACVLFPLPLRDTLLRAAEAGLYRLHWSHLILEEVRRNLVKTGRLDEQRAMRLVDKMQEAFPDALVTGFEPLIGQMTNSPKDRHVLAAAAAVGADVIVTDNLRDFPERALAPHNVAAQSADQFLTDLLYLYPHLMPQIVIDQALFLRVVPLSTEQVLDRLARQAPRFAALVRESLT